MKKKSDFLMTKRGELISLTVHFETCLLYLNGLVQIDSHSFLHACLYHLRGKEVQLSFSVHHDLSEIFLKTYIIDYLLLHMSSMKKIHV